jgi:hypothetical protein
MCGKWMEKMEQCAELKRNGEERKGWRMKKDRNGKD